MNKKSKTMGFLKIVAPTFALLTVLIVLFQNMSPAPEITSFQSYDNSSDAISRLSQPETQTLVVDSDVNYADGTFSGAVYVPSHLKVIARNRSGILTGLLASLTTAKQWPGGDGTSPTCGAGCVQNIAQSRQNYLGKIVCGTSYVPAVVAGSATANSISISCPFDSDSGLGLGAIISSQASNATSSAILNEHLGVGTNAYFPMLAHPLSFDFGGLSGYRLYQAGSTSQPVSFPHTYMTIGNLVGFVSTPTQLFFQCASSSLQISLGSTVTNCTGDPQRIQIPVGVNTLSILLGGAVLASTPLSNSSYTFDPDSSIGFPILNPATMVDVNSLLNTNLNGFFNTTSSGAIDANGHQYSIGDGFYAERVPLWSIFPLLTSQELNSGGINPFVLGAEGGDLPGAVVTTADQNLYHITFSSTGSIATKTLIDSGVLPQSLYFDGPQYTKLNIFYLKNNGAVRHLTASLVPQTIETITLPPNPYIAQVGMYGSGQTTVCGVSGISSPGKFYCSGLLAWSTTSVPGNLSFTPARFSAVPTLIASSVFSASKVQVAFWNGTKSNTNYGQDISYDVSSTSLYDLTSLSSPVSAPGVASPQLPKIEYVSATSSATNPSSNPTPSSGSLTATNTATSPAAAQNSCSFNGVSLASGTSVTAYQSASVAAGSSCVSQGRYCNNGVLSGTYAYSSCSVITPIRGGGGSFK